MGERDKKSQRAERRKQQGLVDRGPPRDLNSEEEWEVYDPAVPGPLIQEGGTFPTADLGMEAFHQMFAEAKGNNREWSWKRLNEFEAMLQDPKYKFGKRWKNETLEDRAILRGYRRGIQARRNTREDDALRLAEGHSEWEEGGKERYLEKCRRAQRVLVCDKKAEGAERLEDLKRQSLSLRAEAAKKKPPLEQAPQAEESEAVEEADPEAEDTQGEESAGSSE